GVPRRRRCERCNSCHFLISSSTGEWSPAFKETNDDDNWEGCKGIHATCLRRATRVLCRQICGVPRWRGLRRADRTNQVCTDRAPEPLAQAPRCYAAGKT